MVRCVSADIDDQAEEFLLSIVLVANAVTNDFDLLVVELLPLVIGGNLVPESFGEHVQICIGVLDPTEC